LKIKREKSTSTKGHYVRNAELLPAVIEAKSLGIVTEKLIRMIWMIAERYSRKSNFIGYTFREDMVGAAVANLCNTALKFDPAKSSNPFSYYTTSINNSFLQFMAEEKKHRNIKDALLVDAGSNPSWNYQDERSESTEPKISDDLEIKDEEVEHDELHSKSDPVEQKPVIARHPKWAAREPGPVVIHASPEVIAAMQRRRAELEYDKIELYRPDEVTKDSSGITVVKPPEAYPTLKPKKKRVAHKKARRAPRKAK
jgi:hypothetical protein